MNRKDDIPVVKPLDLTKKEDARKAVALGKMDVDLYEDRFGEEYKPEE